MLPEIAKSRWSHLKMFQNNLIILMALFATFVFYQNLFLIALITNAESCATLQRCC